jgi:hypothetical protein
VKWLFMLAAVPALLGSSSGAIAAADLPVLGTTTTTMCRYDSKVTPGPGLTYCTRQIVTISGGDCYITGYRLYFEDVFSSARYYQGNVVPSSLDGVTVTGDYGDVVRPHARLVYDSGDHAFGVGFLVPDESCP